MDNRLVVAVAAAFVVGVAGCSSPPAALGGTTAKVTINGQSAGDPAAVTCLQTGWLWQIKTHDEAKGFTVALDTGDEVKVRSVDFNDFGGFNGTVWQGKVGQAEVTGTGGKFTIEGSADGNFTDKPSDEVTATFRIEANC
jgi:ipoprotein LpqH